MQAWLGYLQARSYSAKMSRYKFQNPNPVQNHFTKSKDEKCAKTIYPHPIQIQMMYLYMYIVFNIWGGWRV